MYWKAILLTFFAEDLSFFLNNRSPNLYRWIAWFSWGLSGKLWTLSESSWILVLQQSTYCPCLFPALIAPYFCASTKAVILLCSTSSTGTPIFAVRVKFKQTAQWLLNSPAFLTYHSLNAWVLFGFGNSETSLMCFRCVLYHSLPLMFHFPGREQISADGNGVAEPGKPWEESLVSGSLGYLYKFVLANGFAACFFCIMRDELRILQLTTSEKSLTVQDIHWLFLV